MEGLSVAEAKLTVYVHPSNSRDVPAAVRRQLSSLLFTYDERFEGILLAYQVAFQSKKAKILSGLIPYFGVPVRATLLLFSPRPDMLLEGKVVKVGKDSIHAVVLGFSSVAMMAEDIRDEFKFKDKGGDGRFVSLSHRKHVIKFGSMIRFLVKSVDEEILHISGSLLPSYTGCIRWLSKHGAESSQSNSSRKRRRDAEIEAEHSDQNRKMPENVDHLMNSSRPHKSRKRNAKE